VRVFRQVLGLCTMKRGKTDSVICQSKKVSIVGYTSVNERIKAPCVPLLSSWSLV